MVSLNFLVKVCTRRYSFEDGFAFFFPKIYYLAKRESTSLDGEDKDILF